MRLDGHRLARHDDGRLDRRRSGGWDFGWRVHDGFIHDRGDDAPIGVDDLPHSKTVLAVFQLVVRWDDVGGVIVMAVQPREGNHVYGEVPAGYFRYPKQRTHHLMPPQYLEARRARAYR